MAARYRSTGTILYMYEPVGRGKEDVFVRVATSIMARSDRFMRGGGWAAGLFSGYLL